MSRRFKLAAAVFVAAFAAAQVIRPERSNPPTDASRTIQAHVTAVSGLCAVLDRACNDCHSNETVWSRYTQIAPLSWLVAYGVREGRKAVNFSEWAAYPAERQRTLLDVSCQDASSGKMPGSPFTLLRPEARLSTRDIALICAASAAGMHQSVGKESSVSREAVEYCRQHDIAVIAGACPMMFGAGVDIGHVCMRWILGLTGRLPA